MIGLALRYAEEVFRCMHFRKSAVLETLFDLLALVLLRALIRACSRKSHQSLSHNAIPFFASRLPYSILNTQARTFLSETTLYQTPEM